MDPISTILWFSESLEWDLSNGAINVHIWEIKVFANFGQIPWIIAHGPRPKNENYHPNKILDWNTSFERSFSKLSENHKNFEFGSIILKLWLLKDVQLHPPLISLMDTTAKTIHLGAFPRRTFCDLNVVIGDEAFSPVQMSLPPFSVHSRDTSDCTTLYKT